jgi:L-seryl-tRNA(Ser) seleniumtransferase
MDPRRSLPSVDRVLSAAPLAGAHERWARRAILAVVREFLDAARRELGRGVAPPDADAVARAAADRLAALDRPGPRRVINATGVVIHTNLGRARLSPAAAERVLSAATSYSDLEFDLVEGVRGSRTEHFAPWLRLLFPGRGVHAVNNNAGAVLLALNTLARGRDVVISRGELVEIGGSFRVPEILERSGGRLVEVGTTNRTHLRDYEQALGPDTGLILKVWPSNYRVVGFTKSIATAELAALADRAQVPLVCDQGCGRLFREAPGPPSEVSVEELLDDGVDLVCFSGDKMLGGPQAGVLIGDPALVRRCAQNPLARALRLSKLEIAALSETCRAWLAPDAAASGLPVASMLAREPEALRREAQRLQRAIRRRAPAVATRITDDSSRVGGGAAPEEALPTHVVELRVPGLSEDALLRRLRRHDPPVVARAREGVLVLDPRTLTGDEHREVAAALAAVTADVATAKPAAGAGRRR